jgi:hypothetical protein
MVPQRQGAVEGTGYVVGADWLVTNLGYREAKSLLLFRDGEEVIRTRPSPASGSCHSPLAVHGATVYAAKIAVCAILHSSVSQAKNGRGIKNMREGWKRAANALSSAPACSLLHSLIQERLLSSRQYIFGSPRTYEKFEENGRFPGRIWQWSQPGWQGFALQK